MSTSTAPIGGRAGGARKTWAGMLLPAYTDRTRPPQRQPTIDELSEALCNRGPYRVWLQRQAVLNPERSAALSVAFQARGRAGLRGLRYRDSKPCRRCGQRLRTAIQGRCTQCYGAVRFNAPRKHSEAELARRERARQQRRLQQEQQHYPVYIAGAGDGWIGCSSATGLSFWHPECTQRVLRELTLIEIKHYMQHQPQFRELFLHLVENQPLPDWAVRFSS